MRKSIEVRKQELAEALIYKGHVLELAKDDDLDDKGSINWFALDYDIHNGPRCSVCKTSWCVFCTKDLNIIRKCEGIR